MSNTMAVAVQDSSKGTSLMATTRDAVLDGIADARATVEEAWPKVAESVNKGIYNLAYGVAFGVAFPVVLIGKSIPQNNCVVWGLIDGAKAARTAVNRISFK